MRRLLGILLLIFLFLYCAAASWGKDTKTSNDVIFDELVVSTSESHLLLFAQISNSFSEEMIAGLKSGIPIDFSFFVELKQKRDDTWTSLIDNSFTHKLIYDTLKEQFKVELGELANKQYRVKEIDEAKTLMSQINGFEVIDLARLQEQGTYRLSIRADLFEQTLPLSLHYILPFVSWWDRKVDWHSIDFNYSTPR